jgi:hypothetical protein
MQEYYQDPTNVDAVFLLGHVPIRQSGYLNYDGHGARTNLAKLVPLVSRLGSAGCRLTCWLCQTLQLAEHFGGILIALALQD